MIYKFIDNQGTFTIKNPRGYSLYFPLTNKDGSLLSSISPNLAGDIKVDNDRFISPPASIEDLRSNLLCRRDFFIKLKPSKKILRLSSSYQDTLEAGFLYHKVIKRVNSLHIEVLNFIPYNLDVEVMQVKLVNKGRKDILLSPTSFIPLYGRGADNLRDHRHVSSLLNRISLNKYGVFLKPTIIFDEKRHKINETVYFCLGFQDNASPPIGQFPTLDYFYGRGDLLNPDAIEKNVEPVTKKQVEFDGKEALAAFRFKNKLLKKNEEVSYFFITGASQGLNSGQKISDAFRKLNSPAKINRSFLETKKYWLNYLGQTNFDFKDKTYNNWLLWVKLQPTLRKLFGCSFLPHFDYGRGGRGWRDLWQDALTLLLNEPEKAKELMLNGFKGIRIDGTNATIITKQGNFISDRNRISRVWMDHGIWPYISLRLYINRTGDLNILNKNVTYFQDHLLKRAKQINYNVCHKDLVLRSQNNNIYKGSILEHLLIQHLTSFFNVGKHNIIRLENADWNDGLDMAYDKGESAAFSFMYAHNLGDLCFYLKKLGSKVKKIALMKELSLLLDQINTPINYNNFRAKKKRLDEYLEKTKNISGEKKEVTINDLIYDLEKKTKHLSGWLREKEWLNSGFFNGYYDNKAERVEGKSRGKIKMMLASCVFAIMSGVATRAQIKKIWESVKKHLRDSSLGGFRLNTDFDSLGLDLGRAFGFSYGDKENGAFFNHMAVMLGNALYSRGFIKQGREVINSIYKMATANKGEIPPLIPEYFNASGKGLYLYLTGSASWYIYTLLEEILGVKFCIGDLILEPKLMPSDFFKDSLELTFPFEGKKIKISYIRKRKANSPYTIRKVLLENNLISSESKKCLIKKEVLRKIRKREINIKVYLQ